MILRLLIRLHRYLGVLLCLLLLLWSLSGVVMIYADFPSYTPQERRADATPLALDKCRIGPEAAVQKGGVQPPLRILQLRMRLGDPIYHMVGSKGGVATVNARTGKKLQDLGGWEALKVAATHMEKSRTDPHLDTLKERDRWTPQQDYIPHLPLYKVGMGDPDGNVLYVSSKTGELVQEHDREERILAWLGPIPHWLYFRDLRVHRELWIDTVIVLASLGTVMCLLGLVVGVVRVRKRKGRLPDSVYKRGWFRWHHYLGFFFGIFLFTWTLSGALSLDPFDHHHPTSLSAKASRTYRNGSLEASAFPVDPQKVPALRSSQGKELRFHIFGGKAFYLLYDEEGLKKAIPADTSFELSSSWIREKVRQGIRRLHPNDPLIGMTLLKNADAYYYGGRRLPVLRMKVEDPNRSWYYADPRSGAIRARFTASGRLDRWFYHGLHSLDFPGFYQTRPLWDIVLIVLLLGSILLSGTGVVLAVKWAMRKFKRLKHSIRPNG